jgi:hypothetical protein
VSLDPPDCIETLHRLVMSKELNRTVNWLVALPREGGGQCLVWTEDRVSQRAGSEPLTDRRYPTTVALPRSCGHVGSWRRGPLAQLTGTLAPALEAEEDNAGGLRSTTAV